MTLAKKKGALENKNPIAEWPVQRESLSNSLPRS